MERSCRISGKRFQVSAFEAEYCRKNGLPLPGVSPRERLRGILVFRNRPHLYNGICAATNKRMLTGIPPESGFRAVDVGLWFSNDWDPLAFGRDYDFSVPFFAQFEQLVRQVPLPSLWIQLPTMENSDYTNGITSAKNCYLLFTSSFNEDCLFSYSLWKSRDVVDSIFVYNSQLCFDCADVRDCYDLKFSEHCLNCSESAFLASCTGCRNCYRCANLSQKQYCFGNEQLAQADYSKKIKEIDLASRGTVGREREELRKLTACSPLKFYFGRDAAGSTGNYLTNTKNCRNSFFVSNSEDLENCLYLDGSRSSILHAMYGNQSELVYASTAVGDQAYNIKFSVDCWQGVQDLEYCFACIFGSSSCFGCAGLKKASYCILNKQYSKADYLDLTTRIREHMKSTGEYGRFFPSSCSPYYYNQSAAQEYLPLSRGQALAAGFRWRDEEQEEKPGELLPPDHIGDAGEDVLGKNVKCAVSGKLFRFIRPEVDFYRKHSLPLPVVSPMERIKSKLAFFNIQELEPGLCMKCSAPFVTALSNQARPLYCGQCYNELVFA